MIFSRRGWGTTQIDDEKLALFSILDVRNRTLNVCFHSTPKNPKTYTTQQSILAPFRRSHENRPSLFFLPLQNCRLEIVEVKLAAQASNEAAGRLSYPGKEVATGSSSYRQLVLSRQNLINQNQLVTIKSKSPGILHSIYLN